MSTGYTKIVVPIVVVIALAGGTAAIISHNHKAATHTAMMQAEAMKKADAAKAMKQQETDAMKKSEAAKAPQTPASGDAMSHDTTATTPASQ